jgi:putative transposase
VAQKKAVSAPRAIRRSWIETPPDGVSIVRQCAVAGVARATYYYEPVPEREENLMLMRLIDERFLKRPFYGVPRMTDWLRTLGHGVNHKRVARLMRLMNLQAVVPGPHTSQPHPTHAVYPYLLRDLVVDRPNYVWCADITYVPMRHGFLYLVAVLDWYSRYVLAWALSNTLEARFCLEVVDQALASGQPQIFNTDQGAQFTGAAFTGRLAEAKIRISMDGRGRALDNVFVERLWRSVTYEEVYLRDYADGAEAWQGLNRYVAFYNTARRHQSLGRQTPAEVHFG